MYPPSLSFPPSQFHGGSLKADVLRPKCPDMMRCRERQEEHADVFTDVNIAHIAAQRVCAQWRVITRFVIVIEAWRYSSSKVVSLSILPFSLLVLY